MLCVKGVIQVDSSWTKHCVVASEHWRHGVTLIVDPRVNHGMHSVSIREYNYNNLCNNGSRSRSSGGPLLRQPIVPWSELELEVTIP